MTALSLNLTINGEPRTFEGEPTLAALVASLGLDLRKVAVERNLEVIPRRLLGEAPIADGDRIEIVHFIGGG